MSSRSRGAASAEAFASSSLGAASYPVASRADMPAEERPGEDAGREDARREAHTLAGAVAFFGYLDASRLASDLERIFEGPAMADPERLRDLVAKLRGALKALPYTL